VYIESCFGNFISKSYAHWKSDGKCKKLDTLEFYFLNIIKNFQKISKEVSFSNFKMLFFNYFIFEKVKLCLLHLCKGSVLWAYVEGGNLLFLENPLLAYVTLIKVIVIQFWASNFYFWIKSSTICPSICQSRHSIMDC